MFKNYARIAVLLAAGAVIFGCSSVGNAPSGASADQMKQAFDKLPVEEQVKTLLDAPGPAASKADHIRELYAKAGKPVPPDIEKQIGGGGGPGAPGAPGATAGGGPASAPTPAGGGPAPAPAPAKGGK